METIIQQTQTKNPLDLLEHYESEVIRKRKQLKQEIKILAQQIKEKRKLYQNEAYRKQVLKKSSGTIYNPRDLPEFDTRTLSWKFRHYHIAASLLRGKTREQIERKVRGGKEPDEKLISDLLIKYGGI